MSENDPINPSHYKTHPSGIECIEVTRHMGFNIGNAVKYLWRFDKKGAAIQDIKKAIWYLEDQIKMLENSVKEHHIETLGKRVLVLQNPEWWGVIVAKLDDGYWNVKNDNNEVFPMHESILDGI